MNRFFSVRLDADNNMGSLNIRHHQRGHHRSSLDGAEDEWDGAAHGSRAADGGSVMTIKWTHSGTMALPLGAARTATGDASAGPARWRKGSSVTVRINRWDGVRTTSGFPQPSAADTPPWRRPRRLSRPTWHRPDTGVRQQSPHPCVSPPVSSFPGGLMDLQQECCCLPLPREWCCLREGRRGHCDPLNSRYTQSLTTGQGDTRWPEPPNAPLADGNRPTLMGRATSSEGQGSSRPAQTPTPSARPQPDVVRTGHSTSPHGTTGGRA